MNVSPGSDSLLRSCTSIANRLNSASHDINKLIAKSRAPGPGKTTTQLAAQLRMFGGTVAQLRQLLDTQSTTDGATVISDLAHETMRAAFSTSDEIVAEMVEHLKLVNPPRGSLWDEPTAQEYVRMVATQFQTFSLFIQLLALNNPTDQDSVLETSENLKILYQGSKDAQSMRERATSRLERLERRPIFEGQTSKTSTSMTGRFDIQNLLPSLTRTTTDPTTPTTAQTHSRKHSSSTEDTILKSSSSSILQRSSVSKLFNTLTLRPQGTKSSADLKLLFSQLCQACRDGDLEWARNQLDEGAEVNGLDARCFSPLYYAVVQGSLEIVKLLVEHGAHVGGADGQSSAMVFFAVKNNNIPVLSYLLGKSAPVSSVCFDSRDRYHRRTPLLLAVENGQYDAAKLLLDHGADVHGIEQTRGLNPLCAAADKRHPRVVELLLDCQARIDGRESATDWGSGLAAVHVAAYRGHDDIVKILVSAGAEISITCTRGDTAGVTALHLATGNCAEKLMQYGAKIFARDSEGQFPLSGAVQVRSVESVRALLRHNAPVNAQDRKGDTALHIACKLFVRDAKAGKPEHLAAYVSIAEELLAGGANPGSRTAVRRLMRAESAKLLKGQTEVDTAQLGLVDLMKKIAGVVEARAAAAAASTNGVRDMPKGILAQSTLALVVTR